MEAYLQRDYARAIRSIMECADHINQYVDAQKPWVLAKDPTRLPEVQLICTMGLNAFRLLMIYLKPVLPHMAQETEHFLNDTPFMWNSTEHPLLNHVIHPFVPLMTRVDPAQIEALLNTAVVST